MELIYDVSLEVYISTEEAALLYRYISLHPDYKKHITIGHFAYNYKDFVNEEPLYLRLTKKVLNICAAVLEDQDFNIVEDIVPKKDLIDKFYEWSKIICDEEDLIEDYRTQYDYLKYHQIVKEDDYFSLAKYFRTKFHEIEYLRLQVESEPSIASKIKRYFGF
ncbi:hypothetical protein SAMN05443633_11253 [Chryseobacterium arachidis]|uniref:Uncharacterized protein n=1 Tax=Chryseobacterium arachidis TaxID=1416778 RepID=A0A1M5I925_9FLAO|nr:hypothetical protein [Chryseobacterium arachidis]SHG24898.1 hypothetical protein SAMN05443633_11253 [Chryseobacterium arachidis]